MALEPGELRRTVVDAVLLAFRHSKGSQRFGSDALRSLLNVQYRSMVAEGEIDLEPLWKMLSAQPSVTEDLVVAPFAALKMWETYFDTKVALPAFMSSYKMSALAAEAASLRIPRAERAQVFGRLDTQDGEERPQQPSASDKRRAASQGATSRSATAPVGGRLRDRPAFRIGVIGVALVGFAIAGWSLYSGLRTGQWDETSVALPAGLPVADASRLGSEVGVTLTDPTWLQKPASERIAMLSAAFENLERDGVSVLFLRSGGEVVATAQRASKSRKIVVRFR